MSMKRFWIVKHGPCPTQHKGKCDQRVKPHDNYVYESKEAAEEVARRHASKNRIVMVVMELVSAFEPPQEVVELEVID